MIERRRRRRRSDSSVLRYLRNIEAKLDRINERLDKFLSAPKTKSKRAAHIPKRVEVFQHERSGRKVPKEAPGRCRRRYGDRYHWRTTRAPRLSAMPEELAARIGPPCHWRVR
jgi:hypothetical protein